MTELGNRLRAEREAKGITLEDLQEITKIQKRYLLGIEEGNYAPIPGNFYVRAFIKQYAEAVGLEPEEIFHEYAADIPASFHDDLPEQLSRVSTRKTVSSTDSRVFDIIPKLLVGVFVIGAIFAIWFIFQSVAGDNTSDNTANNDGNGKHAGVNEDVNDPDDSDEKPVEEPDDDEPDEPAKPEPALETVGVNGTTTSYALKNAETFNLEISSTGETWVQINGADGTIYYADYIYNGENVSFDLTKNSPVDIRVGYAPDTKISVNGMELVYEISPENEMTQNIIIQFEALKGE